MFKNKKIIFILVILLILLYFIINIVVTIPKKGKYTNTVFLGSYTKVTIKNGNINVYNEDTEISKLDVKIFFKNKFIDGYIFTTEEATGVMNYINAYNFDGKFLILDSTLIAHTKDISIKIKGNNKNENNSLDEVYQFAAANKITLSNNIVLDYSNITNFDIDDDGKEEYIYSIGLIEDAENYMTFVFMKKDNKYILIDSDKGTYNELPNTSYRFFNLIDFNNDDNYEFVVEKIMSEYGPVYYELYNFNGNSFTKIE